MAHNLTRFSRTIFNTPQYIIQSEFDPIAQYLIKRQFDPSLIITTKKKDKKCDDKEGPEVPDCPSDDPEVEMSMDEEGMHIVGNIGVIEVEGALSYQPIYTLCGKVGTSYEELIEWTSELAEMGIKTIIYEFSSGGGQAAHLWDTTQTLRDILTENGIRSIAYIDEYAASAAYALAVICDEVIIHPSAEAGSIGCVVCLTDYSKAMDKEGIKPIYITSTSGKVPFNEDGSFSDKFLAKVQESVDRLGDEFVNHVAKYTGLSVEEIKATDAQSFYADKALALGLVNKVMTHREFNNYLSTII